MASNTITPKTVEPASEQGPEPINILDLISVPVMSQKAAIASAIAYEQEYAVRGQFPLMIHALIPRAYRISVASEQEPLNCVLLAGIQQFTSVGLSVLINKADHAEGFVDYVVFRQAGYSDPMARYIEIEKFPREKEAIEHLLIEFSRASGKAIENTFVGLYYVGEDGLFKANQTVTNDAAKVGIVDIPSFKELNDAINAQRAAEAAAANQGVEVVEQPGDQAPAAADETPPSPIAPIPAPDHVLLAVPPKGALGLDAI